MTYVQYVNVLKTQSEYNKGTLKGWLHLYVVLAKMYYSIRHIFANILYLNYLTSLL